MANEKVKAEMKGTGGGRWCTRETAKYSANRTRRRNDDTEIEEGLVEFLGLGFRFGAKR
jgi:hypothetical protein